MPKDTTTTKSSNEDIPQKKENKKTLDKTADKKGLEAKDIKMSARTKIVELATAPEKILKQVSLFEELKRKLLSSKDYQNIGGKQYIKKSGWRMFSLAFNLSDEILKEERKEYKANNQEYFAWEVTVRVTAPNGRYAEATASCSSNEKRFTHPEHDVRATAHTRAKNRAIADLIGGGEVSAEEMDAVLEEVDSNYDNPSEQLATHKQLAFIKRLAQEKHVEDIGKATGVGLGEDGIVTKTQASEVIEKLMRL